LISLGNIRLSRRVPLAGCGWPPEKVEALIKDDVETLALWREATVGKPHRHDG